MSASRLTLSTSRTEPKPRQNRSAYPRTPETSDDRRDRARRRREKLRAAQAREERQQRQQRAQELARELATTAAAPVPVPIRASIPTKMSTADAITLYRETKAARADRNAVMIVEVRAAFNAQIARDELRRNGGRPRKRGIVVGKADPADALVNALRPMER